MRILTYVTTITAATTLGLMAISSWPDMRRYMTMRRM
jgi:hypothetical protein